MQYLAWRVLVGLHKTITISFLIVGHTKFAPDWCFGLLKQKFRKTKVDCLDDIAKVVQGSAEVNEVQLVATQEGEVLVPIYNWADFFHSPFNQSALKGIKKCITSDSRQNILAVFLSKKPRTNQRKKSRC